MFRWTAIPLLWVSICLAQDNLPRMEQVIRSYADNKQFMGSVLVARNAAVLLNKGYGFADLEWEVPNSPTTKFRLGSITKQFTQPASCYSRSADNSSWTIQ